LGTIERCIRLWSNPGETIFSPFAGIGSEGYTAIKFNRKFIGIELKEAYWRVAARNLKQAEVSKTEKTLFSL
jgi:DNA modification methylase